MSRFRFSLSALFVVVAIVGVFCATLARPSGGWNTAAHAVALACLFFSVLAALFGKPTWRVFWGGFAAVGWGWFGIDKITTLPMPTESLSEQIALVVYGATTSDYFASLRVFFWFWPLLLGFVGGIVAVWLDASRRATARIDRGEPNGTLP